MTALLWQLLSWWAVTTTGLAGLLALTIACQQLVRPSHASSRSSATSTSSEGPRPRQRVDSVGMTTTRLRGGDAGAAAVEYGLLLVLVAGAVLGAVTTLGGGVEDSFERTCRALGGGSTHVSTPPGHGKGLSTAPGLTRRRC